MPTVANRHHLGDLDWEHRRDHHYIGRGTPLGNPFRVSEYPDALDRYRTWLWSKLKANDPSVLDALSRIDEEDVVICSCKPKPCHGDVVVKAWHWCLERGLLNAQAKTENHERQTTTRPNFAADF